MYYIIQSKVGTHTRVCVSELNVRSMSAFLYLEGGKSEVIGFAEKLDFEARDIPKYEYPNFAGLFRVGKDTGKLYIIKECEKALDLIPVEVLEDWLKSFMSHSSNLLKSPEAAEYFLQSQEKKINVFVEYLKKRQAVV